METLNLAGRTVSPACSELAGPGGLRLDEWLGGIKLKSMAAARPEEAGAEVPGFESIEELFTVLESPLLSYALRLVPERETDMAEDVVQEAFLRLQAQFDQVREPRRWLYRTVHNLALNQRRQGTKTIPLDGSVLGGGDAGEGGAADTQPLPDEQIARWEAVGLVRLSLMNLDARSQEVVRLKFNDDLSYKEISERTGLSVGHVGYLLHHALKSLAVELHRAGLVP